MQTPPPNGGAVQLGLKQGSGVGATVSVYHDDVYVGTLTFHNGGDWQVTDSSQATQQNWDNSFAPALALAREQYPTG